jgi:outer membrane protein assembly complex protein YaeT
VTAVEVQQEGQAVTDPLVLNLLETRAGMPLSMADVRETITHLISLTRYQDVQVFQEPTAAGVRLRYVLFPIHAVDRIEFRGTLGVPEDELRRAIVERFGTAPVASRAADVARTLQAVYRDRGYLQPMITPRIEITHAPDRASMVFDIIAGPRAAIRQIEFDGSPEDRSVFANTAVAAGQPYDASVVDAQLQKYQTGLRNRGFYEARASHTVTFTNGGAIVHVMLDRGPHVSVAFSGDAVPEADRDRLVPIKAEASADEDLLEDSDRAIEDYFHARGYRDAMAIYTREEANGELTVRFTVTRGPRYVVDQVTVNGNNSMTAAELMPLVRMKASDPFVQATLDNTVSQMRTLYRGRGFTRAMVTPTVAVLPLPVGAAAGDDRHVQVAIDVAEGPRAFVGAVTITGNTVLGADEIRGWLATVPGKPYSEVDVASDRDRVDLEYRNRGYENVVVEPMVALAAGDTRANVTFAVTEGPQVRVDHVIIVGNKRTSMRTIEREVTLKSGQPLGYSDRINSQQKLSALGLFRRVTITELQPDSQGRRDVLIQVEEAPPTTIAYGGGLEAFTLLRPTGPNGEAQQRFEYAPRGSFEIGRSNLWGKNRSVDLFTRGSLKSRDIVVTTLSASPSAASTTTTTSNYGINEYRVLGTYREPKVFNTRADLLLTGILDQAIRSSFNFRTRAVRAEAGWHATQRFSIAARYSFQHTTLFDQALTPDEDPVLIDKLFPQVRLSIFSNSLIRDSRDDLLDPSHGTFLALTTDLSMQAIGSEVGFIRAFGQAFEYIRLPMKRRVVFATAERVGLARGFLTVTSGTQSTAKELPASERFFAGGDTTVRGFALDRLGTPATISATGFPAGGNGEVVLNAELRVDVAKGFAGVTFLDAGQIYQYASSIDLSQLRPAAGFGVHYKSPIGPIRVELGFNLHPQPLVAGTTSFERRMILNVSFGQAF